MAHLLFLCLKRNNGRVAEGRLLSCWGESARPTRAGAAADANQLGSIIKMIGLACWTHHRHMQKKIIIIDHRFLSVAADTFALLFSTPPPGVFTRFFISSNSFRWLIVGLVLCSDDDLCRVIELMEMEGTVLWLLEDGLHGLHCPTKPLNPALFVCLPTDTDFGGR